MKTQFKAATIPVDSSKKVVIAVLFLVDCAIAISGAFFTVYSFINNISFKVINTQVPGILFGLVVLYFGIRYFFLLMKLKDEVYKPVNRFSWSNFKLKKKQARSK